MINLKRQKIRRTMLLISFLLFPVTMYYFSPYLIIQAGLKGIVSGSFIMFVSMFAVSLLFGRAFCGWLCPAGGLMDACSYASDKRAKGGKLNLIKFVIWIPWVITIILVIIASGGIKKIDFFYLTQYGISISEPNSYIIYYFIIALFAVITFVCGRRAGCHYFCWMAPFMIIGSKIKNKLSYPSLKLKAEPEKCINCNACSKQCPMSLEVNRMVQKNNMNNSECILCGMCIDSCNKRAIKYSFGNIVRINDGKSTKIKSISEH
jgi:ferredoxin-type protein NapH